MEEFDCDKPLENSRHEKFAQFVAEGKSQTQAYIDAGYSDVGADGNAVRLIGKDRVACRIGFLKQQTAASAELSRLDVLKGIESVIGRASLDGSHSAAISGYGLYSKICGYDAAKQIDVKVEDKTDLSRYSPEALKKVRELLENGAASDS